MKKNRICDFLPMSYWEMRYIKSVFWLHNNGIKSRILLKTTIGKWRPRDYWSIQK